MTTGKSRNQSGFSLLEVLIAIAVSGIVVGAIAAAMLTLNRVTASAAKHQKVTVALASVAESLKGHEYVDCGDSDAYSDTVSAGEMDAASLGVDSISVVGVSYWLNDVGSDDGDGGFVDGPSSACGGGIPVVLGEIDEDPDGPGGGPSVVPSPDQGAQLVTIEVRLDDVVQRSTVAKRRP